MTPRNYVSVLARRRATGREAGSGSSAGLSQACQDKLSFPSMNLLYFAHVGTRLHVMLAEQTHRSSAAGGPVSSFLRPSVKRESRTYSIYEGPELARMTS